MSEPQVFMPGDDDPLDLPPVSAAAAAAEVEGIPPAARPAASQDVPFGTIAEVPPISAYEGVRGRGISNELNKHGNYGLAIGVVSAAGALLMFFGYVSLWLVIVGGIIALYFGLRGRAAAKRGLATNQGVATAGAILGAVSFLAAVLYFILVVVLVLAILSGTGA